MSFTIPNLSDAFNSAQAQVDKVDVDILVAGHKGDCVISGCAVTAQGSPDMTVAVAVGVVRINGASVAVSAGNVAVGAAHAMNPRFDLITINDSGTKACTAGTAAANPVFPAIPANSVVLAAVYVPANDTDIDANQIIDKRVIGELPGGTPSGSDTQVQFNDNGVFGGDAGLTYNKTTNKLSIALGALAVSGTAAVAATGTLTLPVNPTLGDTMTIGDRTYTFVAVPAVAGDIERAAALVDTQANIVLAINGAGVNPLHRLVTCGAFAANVATITARNKGVSYNDIVTTETFTSGSNVFGAATLTGGADDTAYIATGASPVSIGGLRMTAGQFLASAGQPGEPTQVIGLIGTELIGDVTHVILGKFISPNEFEESMDVLPPLDNNSTFGSAIRRWGSGYFGQTVFIGVVGISGFTIDVSNNRIAPNADGTADLGASNLRFNDIFTMNGFFEQSEMTAPAAPAANGVRLYAQDNGAGKTQLMALFSSGAAQQVAIQP